jgi:hypothetical protein
MLTLFREGGFPMWFILAFGLVTLGAAARYAARPDGRRLGFIRAMALATLFSTLNGVAADLAAVGHNVSARYNGGYGDLPVPAILLQGFAESMSPAIVGLTMLSLVALIVAVGATREAE